MTMSGQTPFDWIPFYEELATKLAAHREHQEELIAFLEELRARGLTISPLMDKDETGRRFLLTEIDPFTFLGSFNRGLTEERRIQILEAMKPRFEVRATVPTDFSGIPTLNNQSSWFISYQDKRRPGDVERLWNLFSLALGDSPLGDAAFGGAFDRALEVRGTNVNLTMGLFWIRPRYFLSFDANLRKHLKIILPRDGFSFAFYQETLAGLKGKRKADFPHLSYEAWLARKGPPKLPPPPSDGEDYWMVGAYWDESDPQDQTQRFLADGIWENGYEDRYLDLVKAMKVGDRIAIKASTTKKEDLPFNSRGKTVSCMLIKAIGTIVSNPGDGRSIEVEWDPPPSKPRVWYFYTSRLTVWGLRKNKDLAQRLIRFVFHDEQQDYKFFIQKWWDQPDELGETEPYAVADMLREGVFLPESEINLAIKRLREKKNLILQGAPGVGKSFIAKRLSYAVMEAKDEKRVTVVQLHPSYSYEDFVCGYRPTGQAGGFALLDGPFLRICKDASNDDGDREYVLVIEEINRGNLSQVFGELFTLMEADKRGTRHAVTPLYRRTEDEKFYVPKNLFIIGTMNTADRSLALVDFALRRRFAFLTLEPRFGDLVFRNYLKDRGMDERLCQLIITRMTALNARISEDTQLGPAFCVGHSYFCPSGNDFSGLDDRWYRDIVKTEIVPLLKEYWYDAPDKAKSAEDELLA